MPIKVHAPSIDGGSVNMTGAIREAEDELITMLKDAATELEKRKRRSGPYC